MVFILDLYALEVIYCTTVVTVFAAKEIERCITFDVFNHKYVVHVHISVDMYVLDTEPAGARN